jgi:hypothetical protein
MCYAQWSQYLLMHSGSHDQKSSHNSPSENTVTSKSIGREQLGKHVPAKKNSWPTIGKEISIARQRAVNMFHQE